MSCYICHPDDPEASTEGCEACEDDWMQVVLVMLEDES